MNKLQEAEFAAGVRRPARFRRFQEWGDPIDCPKGKHERGKFGYCLVCGAGIVMQLGRFSYSDVLDALEKVADFEIKNSDRPDQAEQCQRGLLDEFGFSAAAKFRVLVGLTKLPPDEVFRLVEEELEKPLPF